jgi:U4/U6.U5 tri-snRNP-associated protein 1
MNSGVKLIYPVAQRKEEEDNAPQANGDEDGRITFDDTSEFVRNVNAESLASQVKRERAATPAGPQAEEPIVVKIERGSGHGLG